MPELNITVEAAETAAASALALRLLIANLYSEERVHAIALTVQLQILPGRRRYSDTEKAALSDVFGEPARWATTVRPLFWTAIKADVPGFTGQTRFDLVVPCDLHPEVAAARYLRALDEGEVPSVLLFSGRVLYFQDDSLRMAPIPWSLEASCRIPVSLCQEVIAPTAIVQRGVS